MPVGKCRERADDERSEEQLEALPGLETLLDPDMERKEQHHDRAVDEDRYRNAAQRSNFWCAARYRRPEQDCRTEEHQQEIADADLVAQASSGDALEHRKRCAEQHERHVRPRPRPCGQRQETRHDRERCVSVDECAPDGSTGDGYRG